ncbi:MAG: hypothetical protein WC718_07280 [Phycisphaerales bacterium]|jgi:hypothetical protein
MPDPKKRQLLRVKRIDTIGLVDRGDNPEADIVFWKRDPGTAPVPGNDPDAARAAEPGTADEVRHMEDLEKAQADATAARAEADALRAEAQAKVDAEAAALAKVAEREAEIAKRDERIAELEKREREAVEKAERDALAIRFAKGGDLGHVTGEGRTDVLLTVKRAVDADTWTAVETMLKAASAQIEKGGLFKEIGTGAAADGETAWGVIQARAAEIVTKGEAPTLEQAIEKVTRADPALAMRYEDERKAR